MQSPGGVSNFLKFHQNLPYTVEWTHRKYFLHKFVKNRLKPDFSEKKIFFRGAWTKIAISRGIF